MRYKVVPAPADRETLFDARAALPMVPGSVEDCCTRIRDRTTVPSRDRAREFLTLLEAMGLAEETADGYRRTRGDVDDATLAERYVDRVFGAREVLDALEGPTEPAAAFEALRPTVPEWERDRHADWEAEWRDRTERLLAWAVVFGLAERTDAGYRPAD